MATHEASFLRDRSYVAVSTNHFFVDVLNSSRTLLVAILAVSIGLTNAQVGIALLLYNVGSALAQPIFGVLADRFGPRWLVISGMGWMIALYGLAAVSGDWLALVAITLAGFGSGAVHPSGTKVASEASHSARTQATAVFFAAGQIGLFLGPVSAGILVEAFGRSGYVVLPALALFALVSGWRWISNGPAHRNPGTAVARQLFSARPVTGKRHVPWRTLIPLTVIIVAGSTVSISTINFAPKLFTELGYLPVYVGWTAGLFMLGSAAGGIAGGTMGDRVGRRPAVLVGVLGAILPLYLYIPADDPWRFVLLLLAGFFGGMPHSVLVISVQALLPGRRAFASGLTLGLMFFSGAIGSFFLGLVADRVGLIIALQGMVVLLLVAAGATLLLPKKDNRNS